MVGPPDQLNPVVAERYQKEILRVLGVLESVLSKQEWLLGERMTVADISFVMSVCRTNFTTVADAASQGGISLQRRFS